MQTTQLTVTAPAKGLDTTLLKLATALCCPTAAATFAATNNSSIQTTLQVQHAFSSVQQTSTATGLTGSLRLLVQQEPLLHGTTLAQQAAVESWLQAVDQTLMPVLRQDKKDPIFQAAVHDFLEHVESHLSKNNNNNNKHLVGETPTLADAVVAVAIAGTCHQVLTTSKMPQTLQVWCNDTCQKLVDCVPSFKDELTNMAASTTASTTAATTPAAPAATTTPATTTPATTTTTTTSSATTPVTDVGDNAILQILQSFGVDFTAYQHETCSTADELVAKVPLPSDKHSHTKNLFLKDKKHGLFLVTVRPNADTNTKNLAKALQLVGKTNMRMADASILDEQLRVKPGCVGPLCMIQQGINVKTAESSDDDKMAITFVLDQALLQNYEIIHSHPLRNDMSVQMTPTALQDALKKAGVEPVVLEFPDATGKAPATRPAAAAAAAAGGKQQQPKAKNENKKTAKKGETLLALQWKKEENFANWYTDVIVLSEMISYYDISGCYILRPWSFKIWELIQEWFNVQIREMEVENCYFPLFVSQDRLEKEKDHVEGFAPEVAWVTKSGEGDLAKHIAIRPTSETIMYPAFADWIRSHRDLPLKLNQWSNVVRWEFKYPTPFLRTREFLWQEGHTAHTTLEDADETVMQALELYRKVYEELLAVPVIPGYKTEEEKFAGGFRTTTVEAYIAGSGRAIQGATSHNLGQNFGKMFDITFQDEKGVTQTAWQTSWGLTTRTIGVMVMVHGDDKGLVLPPRVAPLQVVVVPIVSKKLTAEQADPYCQTILEDLKALGIRVKYDNRSAYNPGWKYNHYEQKGVPIRIEVGPRDIEQKSARIVIRHSGAKEDYPAEGLGALIQTKLDEIQQAMFDKARDARDSHVVQVTEWKDFVPNLEKNNLVMTPWCGGEHKDWEEWVKKTSREESLKARGQEAEDDKTATSVAAKTLCIPFKQPDLPSGTKCIASGLDATCWVLWGRSY